MHVFSIDWDSAWSKSNVPETTWNLISICSRSRDHVAMVQKTHLFNKTSIVAKINWVWPTFDKELRSLIYGGCQSVLFQGVKILKLKLLASIQRAITLFLISFIKSVFFLSILKKLLHNRMIVFDLYFKKIVTYLKTKIPEFKFKINFGSVENYSYWKLKRKSANWKYIIQSSLVR